MIDLHSHTTASDGELSPADLFAQAKNAGVTVLSVTDHDTVAGHEACANAAKEYGITFVPGIELSVLLNRREIHILGHFVDSSHPGLQSLAEQLREERTRRMHQMVDRMRELGFPITMEQVLAIAKEANLGRPHLARLLVDLNYCRNTKEAFDRFLKDGGPAYVDRFRLTPQEAIDLIHDAHGTATLAHPGLSKLDAAELLSLADDGLDGLEVFHSEHAPHVKQKLLKHCVDLSLIATAGSDFHGPTVAPDRHLGSASMDSSAFAALQRRAESLRA